MRNMIDFLQKNLWGIVIGIIALAGNWYVVNYRVTQVEAQVEENRQSILSKDIVLNQMQNTLGVVEEKVTNLKEDTEYIKYKVDRLPF